MVLINSQEYIENCVIPFEGKLKMYDRITFGTVNRINVGLDLTEFYPIDSIVDKSIKNLFPGFKVEFAGMYEGSDISNPNSYTNKVTLYGINVTDGTSEIQYWFLSPFFKFIKNYQFDYNVSSDKIKVDGISYTIIGKMLDLSNDPQRAINIRNEFVSSGINQSELDKISLWNVKDRFNNPYVVYSLSDRLNTVLIVQDISTFCKNFRLQLG
jgi:hypothetical protein